MIQSPQYFFFSSSFFLYPFGLFSSFLLPIQLGKLGRRRRLSLVVVFLEERRRRQS
jgi:hypothetical protein